MADLQSSDPSKVIENIRWVLIGAGGVFSLLTSVVIFGTRVVWKLITADREREQRIRDLEKYQSDMHDRDVGRSLYTQAVYGLSDRTTKQGEAIRYNHDQIEEVKEEIRIINERCERRREQKQYDGQDRRRRNGDDTYTS